MTTPEATASASVSLVDALDHLLNRGAVLVGETTLSLAGIDLVYVGLNLLVGSVETLQPGASQRLFSGVGLPAAATVPQAEVSGQARGGLAQALPPAATPARARQPEAVEAPAEPAAGAGGERPEQGLARLVLTLVELLRQLLERQAVRRMEGAGLADEDLERMGLALIELERKMGEMREAFGLSEADLNLDLGPLGRLLDDRR